MSNVFKHLSEVFSEISVRGIVHVGAHKGEEVPLYVEAGVDDILLIEANPAMARYLRRNEFKVLELAIGNHTGTIEMWKTSWSQRWSLCKPAEHIRRGTFTTECRRLRDLDLARYNVLVLDIQGAELDALRGADLNCFELIILETRDDELYENSAKPSDIWTYLLSCGWTQESVWPHGNGIYDEVWTKGT